MAGSPGRKLPDIVESIVTQPSEYQFNQALRLLCNAWRKDWVKLKPASELSFPATDIRAAELDEKDNLTLRLSFMGLYGVDAPLPLYFQDATCQDNDISEKLRHFLDIFNHHLYWQLYCAWEKYHPNVLLEKPECDYLTYLEALSAFAINSKDAREYAYAGLLGARVHNSVGLEGLVSSYLNNVPVKLRSFIPRWLALDEKSVLDEGRRLGDNTVLGEKVLEQSGKVLLEIGPLSEQSAKLLLPGQPKAKRLSRLIQRYLGSSIVSDTVLIIQFKQRNAMRLGQDEIQLGWISWIGQLAGQRCRLHILVANEF